MNLITRALNKIFKTGNQKELDRIKPLIEAINNQEVNFKALKDEEFKEKTFLLKKNIQVIYLHKIHEELNKILIREKRIDLYKSCLAFLKTRVDLDLALFKDDIWSH